MTFLRPALTLLLLVSWAAAAAQSTTAFHYAGTLTDAQSAPAAGNYDIRVRLYDGSGAAANQLGSDVLLSPVPVVFGYFSIDVDFGTAVFAPQAWLEFAVQPTGSGSGFQTLAPRQRIGHVPFALYAEGADWSGITNVPASIAALTNPVPPAIGSIATSPSLGGAGPLPNQLIVRQIQFAVSRPVQQAPPNGLGAPDAKDVELWLEPTTALPSIAKAIETGGTAYNLTLNLNFVNTASNTIAKFTGVLFSSATLEPAQDASGTTLAHVKFTYAAVQVSNPSFNYTYNLQTRTKSGGSSTCLTYMNTLGYGAVPADFVSGGGFVTLYQPSVFDVTGAATPTFGLPEVSVALTTATAAASATLVTCALQMVTDTHAATGTPTWAQYPPGAADAGSWSTILAWTGVYVTAFGLNSDAAGNVSLSWQLTPITSYQIETQNAAKTSSYTACWNIGTNTPC